MPNLQTEREGIHSMADTSDVRWEPESAAFRSRAESLRQLASGVVDGLFRYGLLTLADDYERHAGEIASGEIAHGEIATGEIASAEIATGKVS
jgi:hypothetical protein